MEIRHEDMEALFMSAGWKALKTYFTDKQEALKTETMVLDMKVEEGKQKFMENQAEYHAITNLFDEAETLLSNSKSEGVR